jgi:hypothetical protein
VYKIKKRCLWLLCILLLISVTACNENIKQPGGEPTEQNPEPPAAVNQDSNLEPMQNPLMEFAPYQEVKVDFSPKVTPYAVEPALGNISNKDMFHLSPEAEQLLVKNGFVVVPSELREFFILYEINRYEPVPSFITADSMLHNYHLFFSHLLRVTEKEKLAPALKELTANMLAQAEKQYTALQGTAWENAAKRNLGFFAVAGKLLDPEMPLPKQVQKEVEAELKLIAEHAGIKDSPLMNMGQNLSAPGTLQEDYSQYMPRGHYANNELLQSYFKAMMWYGRITFRLKSEDETKSAVLITLALNEDENRQKWDQIYQPTNFFVGKSDDLSFLEYHALLAEIYGTELDLDEIISAEAKWDAFIKAAAKLKPPTINSIPIFTEEIQPDRKEEIIGFRFMGQRFTLDAAIFQRLIYREVKENSHGARRMLPKALDIPAAMGSSAAYGILAAQGETDYAGYGENMAKLQDYIAALDQETWTQNLYWNWLYTLNPLLKEAGEGYPSFMRTQAWLRKNLNTFLGSWTELKHDTILYAKQVYAEMGGGLDGVDDRGYVEPNPELYARLAALVNMTKEGLASRNLLADRDRDSLARLEQLALSLKTISEKELSHIPLTEAEYDLIRSYGGQLEHFWLEALRDEGIDHRSAIADNPAALIADVATDPNGWVLEEATGHIFNIYVVVPVDGSLRIARGGVYSHYEFPWPLHDRLTDKKWLEMLDSGQAPPLAQWTETYIAP